MSFPMTIRKVSARHRGNTKDYHLVLITTADNRSVFINRFGKAGAWGSLQVQTFNSISVGKQAFDQKMDEKMGGEYTNILGDVTKSAANLDELKAVLSSYWGYFGKKNAEWLIPGVDTSTIHEPKEKKFKQVGDRWVEEKDPPRLVPDPPADIAAELRKNPDWGSF